MSRALASFRKSKAVWWVFLTLWATFFLLSAGDFGIGHAKVLGRFLGIVCGALAMYTSFAEVTNGTFVRIVVAVGTLRLWHGQSGSLYRQSRLAQIDQY